MGRTAIGPFQTDLCESPSGRSQEGSPELTATDDFQGRQEVLVTDDRHRHEHVEDNEEVDYDASIYALLLGKEPFRKLRGWRDSTLRAVSCRGKGKDHKGLEPHISSPQSQNWGIWVEYGEVSRSVRY